MKAWAEIRQALRSVVRFRQRSLFMALGIAVGIAGLTVLNSIGESTRQETMKRVRNMLGTFDTLIIRPGGGKTRGMVSLATVEPVLKFPDAQALAGMAGIKQVAQVQNAADIDVSFRGHDISPAVFGVTANWLDLRGDQLDQGMFFTAEDERSAARVAVLGAEAAKGLFPSESPLGNTIRIGDTPFQVRGVMQTRGAGPAGGSLDNLILIPVTTASKRLFRRDFLTMIIVQLQDPNQGDLAVRRATTLLRERHHLAPTALEDFTITNPKAVMAQLTGVASTLARILAGVAWLSVLIGGVVILSLMTIAVTERRKEIGLRRSVGASRGDILFQFLMEALIVAAFGGLLGTALGLGGANGVAAWQKLPTVFSWDVLLQTLEMAIGVGLVFGIYPAWRASRVDPVTALRA